jgi:glucose-6-phosphate 1-epimerase
MPTPQRERLYLSPNASRTPSAAIRGGIPVIFPQFGGRGPLVKHGFARLREWQLIGLENTTATFELTDDDATRALWPHPFHARLQVVLAQQSLEVGLEVLNRGEAGLTFTAALHTYLRVARLADVELCGLESSTYEDATRKATMMPPSHAPIRFHGEIDRIYPATPSSLTLHDDALVRIEAEGFRDTVVWNPGATLAASIGDLGAGEHLRFVCVESGSVLEPVKLAPGEHWRGAQRLVVDARKD